LQLRGKGQYGYYFAGGKRKGEKVRPSLHRMIYMLTHGQIPSGHHVHHLDGNTFNNHPSNLIAVDGSEHYSEHGKNRVDESLLRLEQARKLAPAWHASEQGREWHRQHVAQQWSVDARKAREFQITCQRCGKVALAQQANKRFCSRACIVARRRGRKSFA